MRLCPLSTISVRQTVQLARPQLERETDSERERLSAKQRIKASFSILPNYYFVIISTKCLNYESNQIKSNQIKSNQIKSYQQ